MAISNNSESQAGSTLICTSTRADINALAYQGILPTDCYVQIVGSLHKHVGHKQAQLLAEPVANKQAGFIDWYTTYTGEVCPFTDLTPLEVQKYAQVVTSLAKDIQQYADSLLATKDPQQVTRANLLKLALLYPNASHLYLVGTEPVVTCWGFGPGLPTQNAANLCDFGVYKAPEKAITKAEPVAQAKSQEQKTPLAAWLLPLFLLLALLGLLLTDLNGLALFKDYTLWKTPRWPSAAPCSDVVKLREEIAALETQRSTLEDKLNAHLLNCNTKPKAPTPKATEELILPEHASDTSFMQGKWLCATGLINSTTLEPVRVEFTFDAKGKGIGRIYEQNDLCEGPAEAKLEDMSLHITHAKLQCQRTDSSYAPNNIYCQKNDLGKTACYGKNTDGDQWNAVFLKIKTTELP
ncbi:MAG: hypothetical protein IJU79_00700 [Desulfovibrionaceae bacterium]|nr:hypothetical protein [Desulfovibrionaceae bacterium]